MKKFIILLLILITTACSPSQQKTYSSNNNNNRASGKPTITTIRAIFTRGKQRTVGDFTNVRFDIETSINHVITSQVMQCEQDKQDRFISCNATTDLNQLPTGLYRLLVKSGDGLLGCDLFEISPGIIPVVITIDNESTGFYLIGLITQQSGIREDEIYRRVRYILGANANLDYDLEPTLYDLFMYYNGDKNAKLAIQQLVNAIVKNKPLKLNRKHGMTETLKPLY